MESNFFSLYKRAGADKEIHALLCENRHIVAMKRLRELTNCSLAEAREAIEFVRNPNETEIFTKRMVEEILRNSAMDRLTSGSAISNVERDAFYALGIRPS